MAFNCLSVTHQSQTERCNLVKSVKQMRNKAREPEPLFVISIRRLVQISTTTNSQHSLTFDHLPSTLVKRFLDVLADNLSKSRTPIISDERQLLTLLMLLLNPHVTEFDFIQFSALRRSKRYHAVCKHLLRNCQNIRRVRFLNTSMELPVLQMKNSWSNLRSLSFRFHPSSQNADQTLESIQKQLPNIERLEFNIANRHLTSTGVTFLAKMERLVELVFSDVSKYIADANQFPEVILLAAGLVPNLRKLHFLVKNTTHDNEFIEKFEEIFGATKRSERLLVSKLRLGPGLKITGAPNMITEHLVVIGECPPDVSTLSAPNRPLTLAFNNVPPRNIYKVLEERKLGPRIADLRFESTGRCLGKVKEQGERTLDMFRVLAACPNVSTLHFGGSYYDLLHENDFGLKADSFQNYHSIKIAPIVFPKQEDVISIFKMVLIGSQKCKNIVLTDVYQLKALMEAIQENAFSLRLIKTVDINIHNIDTEQLKIFSDVGQTGFSKENIIYSFVATLVCRLPQLETVQLNENSLYSRSPYSHQNIDFVNSIDRNIFVPYFESCSHCSNEADSSFGSGLLETESDSSQSEGDCTN